MSLIVTESVTRTRPLSALYKHENETDVSLEMYIVTSGFDFRTNEEISVS